MAKAVGVVVDGAVVGASDGNVVCASMKYVNTPTRGAFSSVVTGVCADAARLAFTYYSFQ